MPLVLFGNLFVYADVEYGGVDAECVRFSHAANSTIDMCNVSDTDLYAIFAAQISHAVFWGEGGESKMQISILRDAYLQNLELENSTYLGFHCKLERADKFLGVTALLAW